MIKKIIVLLLLSLLLVSCKAGNTSKKSNQEAPFFLVENLFLQINEKFELTSIINSKEREYSYSSLDETIATVSEIGEIIAITPGSTSIIVRESNSDSSSFIMPLVVSEKTADPNISLDVESTILFCNETITLTSEISVFYTSLNWSSQDEQVAIVDSKGEVTAISAGNTTITCSFVYDKQNYSATCEIAVETPKITLSSNELVLYQGDSSQLTAKTTPESEREDKTREKKPTTTLRSSGKVKTVETQEDTNSSTTSLSHFAVSWSSEDDKIATVDSTGKISAVSAGETTIIGSFSYKGITYSATCQIKINSPVVSLNKSTLKLYQGDSGELTATTTPSSQLVSWSSGDNKIATVDSAGKVSALSAGTTTITGTIKYKENSYSSNCTLTVITAISLSSTTLSLYTGEDTTLIATTDPINSTVTWYSGDDKIATVNSSGKVTAITSGSVNITGKVEYGDAKYSSSCLLTVSTPTISLDKSELSLYVGESATLKATTTPDGQTISWSSGDSTVVKVTSGNVEALKDGEIEITGTFSYKGVSYSSSCSVTVTLPYVTMNAISFSLYIGESPTLSASTTPAGQTLSWSSEDKTIITVDEQSGKVSALKSGTTQVTASFTYKTVKYSSKCVVEVVTPSLTIDAASFSMSVGGTITLTITTAPSSQSLTIVSGNSSIATVSSKTITGVSVGTTTITVSFTYCQKTYSNSHDITVSGNN